MNKDYKYEQLQENIINSMVTDLLNEHLAKHNAVVFESYDTYLLISFQCYNLKSKTEKMKKIFIFLDDSHLLLFIEDLKVYQYFVKFFSDNPYKNNFEMLRLFFVELIAADMEYIDEFEEMITNAEDHAIQDNNRTYLKKIIKFRKQLLHLKHYYNQLQVIFDGLLENENKFFDTETLRKLMIIHNRIDHLQLSVTNLRDYVTQMREAYQ